MTNAPQGSGGGAVGHPLEHLSVQHRHRTLHTLRFQGGKGRMDMPHSLLDGAIIRDPKEMLVLRPKALVVVESLGKFRCNTHHIPVVRQFGRIVRIES